MKLKGKTATTGLLAMGIVILLATLGLVYGNWSQTLTIGGSVTTSGLDAAFKNFEFTDYEDDNGLKDVGKCELDTALSTDNKSVVINLVNVYPNYYCNITGGVVNTGQMPVHVQQGTFEVNANPDGLAEYLKIDESCTGDLQLMPADEQGLNAGNLQCKYRITVNKTGVAGGTEVPQKASASLKLSWEIIQFDKVD